jgi:signal peptidase
MEPAFARGDLLVLTWWEEPVRVNDIVVFKIDDRPIPIVHRASKVHEDIKGKRGYFLTKGDNNNVDDRGLYAPGQSWIQRRHIMGRVLAHVPYVGMVTILMNDYPQLKYALLGILGLVVLVSRE